jgi:hypothetical protein
MHRGAGEDDPQTLWEGEDFDTRKGDLATSTAFLHSLIHIHPLVIVKHLM